MSHLPRVAPPLCSQGAQQARSVQPGPRPSSMAGRWESRDEIEILFLESQECHLVKLLGGGTRISNVGMDLGRIASLLAHCG